MGRWLANVAALEASSITAFRDLGAHLRAYAAPSDLLARCERAARDEVRHAELSWDLAAWFDRQLSPAERALVRHARAEAVRELSHDAADDVLDDVVVHAGVPSPSVSVAMVRELVSRAWS